MGLLLHVYVYKAEKEKKEQLRYLNSGDDIWHQNPGEEKGLKSQPSSQHFL